MRFRVTISNHITQELDNLTDFHAAWAEHFIKTVYIGTFTIIQMVIHSMDLFFKQKSVKSQVHFFSLCKIESMWEKNQKVKYYICHGYVVSVWTTWWEHQFQTPIFDGNEMENLRLNNLCIWETVSKDDLPVVLLYEKWSSNPLSQFQWLILKLQGFDYRDYWISRIYSDWPSINLKILAFKISHSFPIQFNALLFHKSFPKIFNYNSLIVNYDPFWLVDSLLQGSISSPAISGKNDIRFCDHAFIAGLWRFLIIDASMDSDTEGLDTEISHWRNSSSNSEISHQKCFEVLDETLSS